MTLPMKTPGTLFLPAALMCGCGKKPKIRPTQKSATPDRARIFAMVAKVVETCYEGFHDAAQKHVVKMKFRVPKAMQAPQRRTT